nr:RNA methyltransferase [bacterium]
MDIIRPTSPTIRNYKALHTSKECENRGLFLLEGEHMVGEALREGWPLAGALITPQMQEKWRTPLEKAGVSCLVVSQEAMQGACQTVTPQGVCAMARLPEKRRFSDTAGRRTLVLDGLQDPGNVGTLIRSAEAAGFDGVICCGGAYPWAPKVVRATMGSILRVPVFRAGDTLAAVQALKDSGIALWAAAMHGENFFARVETPERLAIVIGNEARGVGAEVLAVSLVYSLPMRGKVESLNAAMAGTLMMY